MGAAADDVVYGGVTVLASGEGGRYPCANSLLISGTESTVLVDPSLEVARRGRGLGAVDLMAVTHGHEDHVAGLHVFPEAPALAHPADAPAVADPDTLLAGFGLDPGAAAELEEEFAATFSLAGHEDVRPVTEGDVVDLGGRTLTVLHLPGHTAGHCGFLVEPDGFLFLGDIDLTSFGPYYGDRSSDLDAFEASLTRLRDVEARWYGTAHQRGVVEGRDAFLGHLRAYAAVIDRRDEALLAMLTEPRTLEDVVARRLVYRPHVDLPFVETVERRTAELHLERLRRSGVVRAADGVFEAV